MSPADTHFEVPQFDALAASMVPILFFGGLLLLAVVFALAWLWTRHPFIFVCCALVVAFGVTQNVVAALAVPPAQQHHKPRKHKLIEPRPSGRGSAGEVARVAYDAGFRGDALVTATAVAMAESGGRWGARCKNCIPGYTEDSRCAFQINVQAHPRYRGSRIYDPHTCARAAYEISDGGRNWGPWTTYTSGRYRRHLPAARRAATR